MDYRTILTQEVIGPLSLQLVCLQNFEEAVDDLYRVLQQTGEEGRLDKLCPYFGVLWPAARVLAEWIARLGKAAFAGKTTLELGCGLALPSFVTASLGAKAIATDLHPHVPIFLAKNVALNPQIQIQYKNLDWEHTELRQRFDWILASDVLYEQHHAPTLIRFLKTHLTPNGQAILLDPDRCFWRTLLEQAKAQHLKTQTQSISGKSEKHPRNSQLIRIFR